MKFSDGFFQDRSRYFS